VKEDEMSRLMMWSVCVITFVVARADAGEYNDVLSIGDKAPALSEIIGVDDKKHGLADYKKANAIVVVFTCNHCPVAVAYEERLVALQDDYRERGVQVIAISVSSDESDLIDKMKERAESKGFNFPYLHDATQKSGRAYGAAVTPHVFLLNKERKIAYMGAIDDSQDSKKVTKHYLRDAIDAVLAGKEPGTTETRQFGCGVKYDD
jgi:peroxiredoxin